MEKKQCVVVRSVCSDIHCHSFGFTVSCDVVQIPESTYLPVHTTTPPSTSHPTTSATASAPLNQMYQPVLAAVVKAKASGVSIESKLLR